MPPFPTYHYSVHAQINAIRAWRYHQPGRQIPAKTADHLLLATWDIAKLGVQERRTEDFQINAEMLSRYDLVAIEECNDNLDGLRAIQAQIPTKIPGCLLGQGRQRGTAEKSIAEMPLIVAAASSRWRADTVAVATGACPTTLAFLGLRTSLIRRSTRSTRATSTIPSGCRREVHW